MQLLGDQLIRDAGIGLVELVKNAYDADARRCTVTLEHVDRDELDSRVVVEDDGQGMDLETVLGVWLEPGTEHRSRQRTQGTRSRKFGRLPLGEKGVGRFAVHKLGRRVRLVTRRARKQEVVVDIDWSAFGGERYLEEVPITVVERPPRVFRGRTAGTRIEIADLRERPWGRVRVQSLYRAVQSIRSPFGGPDEFTPELVLVGPAAWLEGMLRPGDVLEESLFRFRGVLAGDRLTYDYRFVPRGRLTGVAERTVHRELVVQLALPDLRSGVRRRRRVDLSTHRIGPVTVDLSIYTRDPEVLRLTAVDPVGLGQVLDANGGLRVYRDGVRVYDYGEPGNDWLELGARRIQMPTRRLGNNQLLGAVQLELATSADLVEKTNREGFVENPAYETFRQSVLFTVAQAEAERSVDQRRLRAVATRARKKEPVLEDLSGLRLEVERLGLTEPLKPYLDRIESQYREALGRLLMAAGTGLNLAAVLHEVERMVRELEGALRAGEEETLLVAAAERIAETLKGLTWLTRRSGRQDLSAKILVREALFNARLRLATQGVEATDGTAAGDPDFRLRVDHRLVLASLMNLIDNSLYWLDTGGGGSRRLHVGTTRAPAGRPGILVADAGPGFLDPPEDLVQPFFTRKPDGMGLGLHIADEVMRAHEGRLLFPAAGEVPVPEGLDGAVVVLEFAEP
ncbi:MAG: ATP-binding protein [Thermoanaerobaculia bacterium]